MFCGRSYDDHMVDWWERRSRRHPERHRPFDDHVERAYERWTVLRRPSEENEKKVAKARRQRRRRADPAANEVRTARTSCYENVESFSFRSQFVVRSRDDGFSERPSLAASLLSLLAYARVQRLRVIENIENRYVVPRKNKAPRCC